MSTNLNVKQEKVTKKEGHAVKEKTCLFLGGALPKKTCLVNGFKVSYFNKMA